MRKPLVPIALGLALAAAAACSESTTTTSPIAPPGQLSASKSGSDQNGDKNKDDKNKDDKNKDDKDKDHEGSSCQVSETSKTTNSQWSGTTGSGGSKKDDDKDHSKKEDDDHSGDKGDCSGTGTITKKLVDVMTLDAKGHMIPDPNYHGGEVTVPGSQTRWLDFQIAYTLPAGVTGVVTENQTTVCNTLGAADVAPVGDKIHCSINVGGSTPAGSISGGVVSWTVLKSGSIIAPIDIYSYDKLCGRRTLINTVVLKLSNGETKTASTSTVINFVDVNGHECDKGTITKSLIGVMTMDAAGHMFADPKFTGGEVTVPGSQTRWLDYQISYTLPPGVTGVVTENQISVCNTLGAADVVPVGDKIHCSMDVGNSKPVPSFSNGILTWQVLTSGSIVVPIDIYSYDKLCGRRTLTNTATLKLSNGQTLTATTSTVINFVDVNGQPCTK